MKSQLKLLKALTGWVVLTLSFVQPSHAQKHAEVKFSCKQCPEFTFEIKTFSAILSESEVLVSEKMNKSGIITTKIPLDFSQQIYISVGESDAKAAKAKQEIFYIEPGSVLEVQLSQDSIWSAKGVLGRVHKHLTRIREVDKERNAVFRNSYNYNKTMDSAEVKTARKQVRVYQDEIRMEIESDNLLPEHLKTFLFAMNAAPEKGFELFLEGHKLISKYIREREVNTDISASFSDLPAHLIDRNMVLSFRYFFPLSTNLSILLRELLNEYPAENSDLNGEIYTLFKQKIVENPGMAAFPDFFLAYCLSSKLVWREVSYEEFEQAIASFRADYPGSPFQKDLNKVLKDFGTLKPGAPAKDFEMVSAEGQDFRLSDFKDKLVYIDLWATWCVPCREEFKFSKELSTRYAGRDDLVFLYVSSDRDAAVWRRFLSENPDLKGVHGLQQAPKDFDPEADKKMAFQLYNATGIPHYILISKSGDIIHHNAPRPSELVKSDYLDELLQK